MRVRLYETKRELRHERRESEVSKDTPENGKANTPQGMWRVGTCILLEETRRGEAMRDGEMTCHGVITQCAPNGEIYVYVGLDWAYTAH